VDVRFDGLETDADEGLEQQLLDNVAQEVPLEGSPVRLHLIEGPNRNVLQIIAPHVTCDAQAVWVLARDIAASYTARALDYPFDETPVDVSAREYRELFAGRRDWRVRLRCLLKALALTAQDIFSRDVGLALPGGRPFGPIGLRRVDAGSELSQRLRDEADRRAVSVFTVLCLAFLRTCEGFNGARGKLGRTLRVMAPFSLRLLPDARAEELYDIAMAPGSIRFDPRGSDEETLHNLSAQLRHQMTGGILAEVYRLKLCAALLPFLPLRATARALSPRIAKTNLVISAAPRVPSDLESFGDVQIRDLFGVGPIFPPFRLQVSFSTFQERLRIVAQYDKDAFPGGIDAEFLDPFLDRLNQLCVSQETLAKRLRLVAQR
jgi:hypothetical protein